MNADKNDEQETPQFYFYKQIHTGSCEKTTSFGPSKLFFTAILPEQDRYVVAISSLSWKSPYRILDIKHWFSGSFGYEIKKKKYNNLKFSGDSLDILPSFYRLKSLSIKYS